MKREAFVVTAIVLSVITGIVFYGAPIFALENQKQSYRDFKNVVPSEMIKGFEEVLPKEMAREIVEGKSEDIYWCYLDFDAEICTCMPGDPVSPYDPNGGINWTKSQAVMEIDMEKWVTLDMLIWLQDLNGTWILNIGNSYSNNGGGGDAGDFSCDSELDLIFTDYSGVHWQELRVFGNDYSTGYAPRPMLFVPEFFDREEDRAHIRVKEGYLLIEESKKGNSVVLQNRYIFRCDLYDIEHGGYDYHYYAAFNRVIDGEYRSGEGVKRVLFVLSGSRNVPPWK